jgi:hypothetical protein
VIKHSKGVTTYFRNHLNPNLSQWKEGSHNSYLWLQVSKGGTLDLFVYVVYAAPIGSKHENESLFQNLAADIAKVQTLGAQYYWEEILMHILQHYQIPLTLVTFVNCYMRLNSLRLSNQALWLSDITATPVLAAGAASSWTYDVMLSCSSLMAEHLVMNKRSSLVWQMGAQHYQLYRWLTCNLVSYYTPRGDNRLHSLLRDGGCHDHMGVTYNI